MLEDPKPTRRLSRQHADYQYAYLERRAKRVRGCLDKVFRGPLVSMPIGEWAYAKPE